MFERSRPHVIVASVAAAAALILTGCASSGGGKAAGGAPHSKVPVPSKNTSAAKLVPPSIAKKGTITIAMDATYPPDENVAANGHTIVGFDADLGKALAGVLGLKPKLENVTFDNIIPGLQDGKYDIGLSSFGDTKAREKIVDFVTYFKAGESFYVKTGSGKKYSGLSSLCGATVAVENGTTEQADAQAQAKKCPAAKKLTVQAFSDQNQVNLSVSSGRADVGFADSQVVSYIVKQSHGQFEVSGQPINVVPYGIALPKGNGMAEAVKAALQVLIKNGTYMEILKKWGVQSGAITKPVIDGAIS